MIGLTDRQEEILGFLHGQFREQGYWPSVREIQHAFGFKSTNAVIGHLRSLERKGALEKVPGQARAFRLKPSLLSDDSKGVPPGSVEVVEIPVLGDIAAGYPNRVEPAGEVQQLQVDALNAPFRRQRGTFAIRVRGDSMIGAEIFDGDMVVVEQREPKDGAIVAALIDGEVTLKRYCSPRGSDPYLKAENPDYPELYPANELVIQGVAKAVVRSL